ncbi:MAG TPA: Na/Pi cotransporter family protein [Chthoniobacterales bacterium]|nr:Na/Pi cotransporter family protein [Chthoniobacterales bacterium]
MPFLNIATGVILVLLGMRYVRKGLDRLVGNRLVDWLQQMTKNRYQAFFAGAVAGCVAPSSTAIAMLSVQMLNETRLTAERMLAVVLGANVGITVSVQLLAFRLQDYAGAFLFAGGIGFLFSNRAIFRGIGQMLLGIGLIFLAMGMIARAGSIAATNPDLKLLFGVAEHYPLLVFLVTALLTLALQSSTASIGLGIGLAQSGLLTPGTMMPWVIGANLGITLTMMLAGWGSTEGRRLAIGSLLIKGCGAAALLFAGADFFAFVLKYLPGAIDRQAANLNTLFNLVLGLAALPVLSLIYRMVVFLIESPNVDESGETDTYLDPLLLQSPSLALSHAAREELRLMDELKLMLRTVWLIFTGKNVRLACKVEELQKRLEQTEEGLKEYLSQVSDENLNEEDVAWKFIVLDYAQDLGTVGTLIRRDLTDAVLREAQSTNELSPEDRKELEALYSRTLERLEKAATVLMSRDHHLAIQLIREKEEINNRLRLFRKRRVEKPVQPTNSNCLDLLDSLRRINSQLTSIGYALVRNATKSDQPGSEFSEVEKKFLRSTEAEDHHEANLISAEPRHA